MAYKNNRLLRDRKRLGWRGQALAGAPTPPHGSLAPAQFGDDPGCSPYTLFYGLRFVFWLRLFIRFFLMGGRGCISALSRTLTRALNITVPTGIAGQVIPIRTTVEQPY